MLSGLAGVVESASSSACVEDGRGGAGLTAWCVDAGGSGFFELDGLSPEADAPNDQLPYTIPSSSEAKKEKRLGDRSSAP